MSTSPSEEPHVVEDCRGILKIYSDGSISRAAFPSSSFSTVQLDDAKYPSVSYHDVTFDPVHNLQLRLYNPGSFGPTQIPLIFYIHGGGFCLGSRAMPSSHNLCLRTAAELRAFVVSVDYRLAPENRLPAAVEDVWTALMWVRTVYFEGDRESRFVDGVDFGRVFVFGDSAGGNIAHNLAVRIGSGGSSELEPVRVRGYVMLGPMFGGSVRTKSELEGPVETFLNLDTIDRFWRLAIPIGESPDYPSVNPVGNLELINLEPILVMVGERDLLRDRIKNYVDRLCNWGKKVEYVEFEGLEHGFLVTSSNPEPANQVLSFIRSFIFESCG